MTIFRTQLSIYLYVRDFFTLTIPDTAEWYLKVQMLMYIFVLLAFLINAKKSSVLLFIFTLAYVCCGFILKLPDYWWMTAMCFPLGFAFADYKEQVISLSSFRNFRYAAGAVCAVALFWRIKGGGHPAVLVLYHLAIAAFVMSFLSKFRFYSKGLALLGKHSIMIYLIHIGLVGLCFDAQSNIWLSAALYICLTFVGTVICGIISDAALNRINILISLKKQ